MTIEAVTAEWDEGGLMLAIVADGEPREMRVLDPEGLYNAVTAAVVPWLWERDCARQTRPALTLVEEEDAYELTDTKHPRRQELDAAYYAMEEDR